MAPSDDQQRGYFLHPRGLAESDEIGTGTRIWAFAHVMQGARVGAECNIGESVFVETGVELGDHVTVKNGVQLWTGVTCEAYVFIGPNATFTNDLWPRVVDRLYSKESKESKEYAKTRVCYGASIGANATIVAGIEIGTYAMVGAGAVVTHDVPAHALVLGNPARRTGWVCSCGTKLVEMDCPACTKQYESADAGLRAR